MKCFYVCGIIGIFSFGACGPLRAGPTAYVATNGAHVYPYDTWVTAASNLQAAVDAVDAGGKVWASNGVYAAGGAAVYGMNNRVALTRAVTLQSVNGPEITFIQGQGPLGAGAVRCAYLTNGAALVGFTLTNGFTRSSGDTSRERSGGGVWLDRGGTVSNCTACGNSAFSSGGGTLCYQGGIVQDCTAVGNTAGYGGGVFLFYGGTVQNCTVTGNLASALGGGVRCDNGGILVNTVIFGNTGGSSSNVYASGTGMSFTNCCTAPAVAGTGNLAADPKFVNAAAGYYRLRADSPCIDAGTNQTWMSGATDFDGKPRVIGGAVDIGAFEAGT